MKVEQTGRTRSRTAAESAPKIKKNVEGPQPVQPTVCAINEDVEPVIGLIAFIFGFVAG